MRSNKLVYILALPLSVTLFACSEPIGEEPVSTNVTFDEYVRTHTVWDERRDEHVVEGDLAFPDLASLRVYFDSRPRGNALTRIASSQWHLSPDEALALTYCIRKAEFGSQYADVVAWLAAAEADWENAADVELTHRADLDDSCTEAPNPPYVSFRVMRDDAMPQAARLSGFPAGNQGANLIVNVPRMMSGVNGVTPTGVFTHELGHVLGFAHERDPSSNTCPGTDGGTTLITPFDPRSVMVAPEGCDIVPAQRVSHLDRIGAATVFGPSRKRDPRIPVYRWRNASTGDWLTVADGEISDQELASLGYAQKTFSFFAQAYPAAGTVAVYRWWHAGEQDWITNIESVASDADMYSWGYTKKTLQFHARVYADVSTVGVSRWYHAPTQDWVTVSENEATDQQMESWGYTRKRPLFHAPSSRAGLVPVFRWWSPSTQDWISVATSEHTDAQMASFGYTVKRFQFFAFTSEVPGTVAVNRWTHPSTQDWVNTTEGSPTDADMIARGYTGKTRLFYGQAIRIPGVTSQVTRWYKAGQTDWVTVSAADAPDARMIANGFGSRLPLFHGLQ